MSNATRTRNHETINVFRVLLLSCQIALSASVSLAQQSDRARAEATARRVAERLQSLQREADQLAANERTLLNDLRRLEVQRQIKAEELARVTTEAKAAASELASTTARIDDLEVREQAERPDLRARLVEIYKLGRARYLRLLLSTSDVRDLARASRMVSALAEADRRRIAEHQQTVDSLNVARRELEGKSRQLQTLRADAERAARSAADAARAHADLIRDVDSRRDLNAQLAGELLSAQQKLQATLRDLSSGVSADVPSLPIRPFRGALEWPVSGAVRTRFGKGAGRAPASNGIEIAAGEGTPIQAVHEGLVAFAEPFAGFGNLVIVDHGAQTFSLYGDLLEVSVRRGARIDRGQVVGTAGTAPTGAAGLYFELRVDGRPVDPLEWLKRR